MRATGIWSAAADAGPRADVFGDAGGRHVLSGGRARGAERCVEDAGPGGPCGGALADVAPTGGVADAASPANAAAASAFDAAVLDAAARWHDDRVTRVAEFAGPGTVASPGRGHAARCGSCGPRVVTGSVGRADFAIDRRFVGAVRQVGWSGRHLEFGAVSRAALLPSTDMTLLRAVAEVIQPFEFERDVLHEVFMSKRRPRCIVIVAHVVVMEAWAGSMPFIARAPASGCERSSLVIWCSDGIAG